MEGMRNWDGHQLEPIGASAEAVVIFVAAGGFVERAVERKVAVVTYSGWGKEIRV